MKETVLALDISTKTGYCSAAIDGDEFSLIEYGQLDKVDCPEGAYPVNFVDWAYKCFEGIVELVDRLIPTVLVIEETAANSKSSHSQKILEFCHFLVAKLIKETKIKSVYFMTGQWRGLVESKMNKAEKDHNKKVKKYKDNNDAKIAYNEQGKRIGKITKKHVAIRRVKELFDLDLKVCQNDLADAVLLAYAYYINHTKGIYG